MAAVRDVQELIPSWGRAVEVSVVAIADGASPQAGGGPVAVPVAASGPVPNGVDVTREDLAGAGFDGKPGQTLLSDAAGLVYAYGIGDAGTVDADVLRDAAAAVARAASRHAGLTLVVPEGLSIAVDTAAQVMVEGAILARYRYDVLKTGADGDRDPLLSSVTLLVPQAAVDQAARGATRGRVLAGATALARDLANCPPGMMTAAVIAECAQRIGPESGIEVSVADREKLLELGCGGLLGVNAGSADEPRMVTLRYAPPGADARLALVGKGIMYDSGGISLKPGDAVHAQMKNDMSGAGAILAAMSVLAELGCGVEVTGYLMCTDNMPSGTATKLGDVLTIRGGKTVEVLNTDAEGRLVMADGLVLAVEQGVDAIVDIATLTGASMRALGTEIAGVFGNDEQLLEQVLACGEATGEPGWQLPMARRQRRELDSEIADIKNMGGPNGGAIHAALFLEEFVAEIPWAHIDIAGTAWSDTAAGWRTKGCTGFGARLLTELALGFSRSGSAAPTGAGVGAKDGRS